MPTPLRLLIVEDCAADAELMVAELRRAGFEPNWERVDSEPAFTVALAAGLDVILTDHDLPTFDALRALALLQERGLDVPLIIVSGTIDEALAVQAIRLGAADYLLKDRLARLGAAVQGAIERRMMSAKKDLAEQALRQSMKRYRALAEASPVGILHCDAAGRCDYANRRWCEMTGQAVAAALGDGWADAVHPEDRAQVMQGWRAAVDAGQPFTCEYRLVTPDGQANWVLGHAVPEYDLRGAVAGYIRTITDITARRHAEDQRHRLLHDLRERVKELTALHETARLLHRGTGSVESLLRQVAALLPPAFQYPEITAARLFHGSVDLHTPRYRPTPWTLRTRFHTADGTEGGIEVVYLEPRPSEAHGPFIAEEQALLVSPAEMLRDDLDRRQAQQQLQASEERFRTLVANLPGAVYRCAHDAQWTMHYLSDAAERITGYPASDFTGNVRRSFADLIPPEDNRRNVELVAAAVSQRRPFELEYRLRHADGSLRWIYEKGQAVFDGDGEPMYLDGAMFDITEIRQAGQVEEERNSLRTAIRAQEQVLGVVGHELRTPLAAARAMAEFLLTDDSVRSPKARQFVEGIHSEVLRMAQMVNDLLEVARLNSGTAKWNWGEVSLAEACEAAVASVRPLIDAAKVRLSLQVEPGDLSMRGDADAIRRLVLNLASNAAKFTDAGRIDIEAGPIGLDPGAGVRIVVRDTGRGMPPETAARLGEPFALNSGVVGEQHIKGAGLGLAICEGIVAAHGGHISVTSARGKGTTVTVTLRADLPSPVAEDPGQPVIENAVR